MSSEGIAIDNMSLLPTDRLVEIAAVFHVLEAALIEIAAAFDWDEEYGAACDHCDRDVTEGCAPYCPGLRARRALGVA
jgi:hypothetical protein